MSKFGPRRLPCYPYVIRWISELQTGRDSRDGGRLLRKMEEDMGHSRTRGGNGIWVTTRPGSFTVSSLVVGSAEEVVSITTSLPVCARVPVRACVRACVCDFIPIETLAAGHLKHLSFDPDPGSAISRVV